MKLLIKVVLGVLLFSIASCYKYCDDCILVTECKKAIEIVKHYTTDPNAAILNRACCGFDGVNPKVCCSDFFTSPSLDVENKSKNNTQTSGDEIENHRNIHLLPTECGDVDGNRIIGGTSAGLYEFPWMAHISYRDGGETLKFRCGGTVITARYVLTSAVCIKNQQIVGVRIGDYDVSQPEDCVGEGEIRECESKFQDIAVVRKIYHRGYVTQPYILNDIGLLRLAKPVDFSYRNSGSICLPITKHLREKDLVDERGVVAGWGTTGILHKVELPIVSESSCNMLYKSTSRQHGPGRMTNTICAGEIGHDACKGDSGGPLMLESSYYDGTYKIVQFGIVSYGPIVCGSERPGVYTDVRKFMKWILDTIKP